MSDKPDPGAIDVAVNSVEEFAKATKNLLDIIKNVDDILSATSRSAKIEVINTTSQPLTATWNEDGHSWGGFASTPKQVIEPYGVDVFGSKSGGGTSGTTGSIFYQLDGGQTTWHVRWDVPFVESNVAAAQVIGTNAGWYFAITMPPGGGSKAVPMRFILTERALTDGRREGDWRTCGLCKSLVHALEPGLCPKTKRKLTVHGIPLDQPIGDILAGSKPVPTSAQYGPHQLTGWTFELGHTTPGPSREEGWRRCQTCRMVFYDGWESKGVCPDALTAQPGHVADPAGHPYILQMNVGPRPDQQTDWRFCKACYGLFFLPHNADGRCPAGELHRPGADRYALTRMPHSG